MLRYIDLIMLDELTDLHYGPTAQGMDSLWIHDLKFKFTSPYSILTTIMNPQMLSFLDPQWHNNRYKATVSVLDRQSIIFVH
jgi:hypothetical protein